MNMKQLTLATAASLALSFTASANSTMIDKDAYATSKPKAKHQCCNDGYNGNWAQGWYIGAGLNGDSGMTDQSVFGQASWESVSLASSQTDFEKSENNIGFDVYVGRRVSKHFAFEMGYTAVGNQHFKAFNNVSDSVDKAEVKQWNVHGTGLIHMPIGDYFNVFAKGGVAYYQNQTDFDANILVSSGIQDKAQLNSFALTYGAGIEVTWDQFGVRGDYTVVAPSHNNQDNFYISDIVGASIFYRFM